MIPLKSGITRKLLSYFFMNPQESLYVNELVKKLNCDKRNLAKKLADLETEGLLISTSRGNLKFFSVNTKYPLYKEYAQIINKTVGIEQRLREILGDIPGITEAFLYGSYARDAMEAHSDIDLLVIGKHSSIALQRKIGALQREINREINAVNMDETELKKRKRTHDPFITEIMRKRHIKLI